MVIEATDLVETIEIEEEIEDMEEIGGIEVKGISHGDERERL